MGNYKIVGPNGYYEEFKTLSLALLNCKRKNNSAVKDSGEYNGGYYVYAIEDVLCLKRLNSVSVKSKNNDSLPF